MLPRTLVFVLSLTSLLVLSYEVSGMRSDKGHYVLKRNVTYAKANNTNLRLDLYLPKAKQAKKALIVWIHGGMWSQGSKSSMPLKKLIKQGYAIASIDYRLTTNAPFPAQLEDCIQALNWLKANQKKYQLPKQMLVAGESAGGHLAALVGLSHTLEADIKGIIVYYGASDLATILRQSTPYGLKVRVPALQKLLGGLPQEKKSVAKAASPIHYVGRHAPPLLIFHGDKDKQMPIAQAYELVESYKVHKRPVKFYVLRDGTHGDSRFYNDLNLKLVDRFFEREIKQS